MESNYPQLLDRIQSTFIDVLAILIVTFVIGSVLDKFENVPDWVRIALFFGLWGVYEPVSTTLGCTLGNYIKGIRVRRHNNFNARINILQSFVRYLLKTTLGWLSFITIHMNSDKRAIHDLVSGSIMIRKNRDIPVEDTFPELATSPK
jgi:uncharacterized RDD family membrane protein YckC